jgi:SPP1 gp7 family putative phage head morphogenesis protein
MTDEMAKKTIQQLTEGIQRGEGVPQLTKRISEVADIGYARAETIARRETMNAVNQGAIDRYKQAGFTQLEWLAALDERTCTRAIEWMGKTYAGCGGLNGQVFDIDKFPQLPAHPNCRCTSIPVMAVKA